MIGICGRGVRDNAEDNTYGRLNLCIELGCRQPFLPNGTWNIISLAIGVSGTRIAYAIKALRSRRVRGYHVPCMSYPAMWYLYRGNEGQIPFKPVEWWRPTPILSRQSRP
jgi:hypothetical protein